MEPKKGLNLFLEGMPEGFHFESLGSNPENPLKYCGIFYSGIILWVCSSDLQNHVEELKESDHISAANARPC